MRSRLVVLTLMAVAALVICAPASAQYVQGHVETDVRFLGPDCADLRRTDCDTSMADSYEMWLTVDVFCAGFVRQQHTGLPQPVEGGEWGFHDRDSGWDLH